MTTKYYHKLPYNFNRIRDVIIIMISCYKNKSDVLRGRYDRFYMFIMIEPKV